MPGDVVVPPGFPCGGETGGVLPAPPALNGVAGKSPPPPPEPPACASLAPDVLPLPPPPPVDVIVLKIELLP